MSINQFTKYGFAVANAVSITGSFSAHEVSGSSDVKFSSDVPVSAFLESLEFELTSIASGDQITVFLARDSDGDVPLTSTALAGSTQTVTIGRSTATKGGCSFTINKDFHFDSTVTNATIGKLYVIVKCVDSGGSGASCTADIRLNWRG